MLTITTRLTLWYLLVFGAVMSTLAVLAYEVFAQTERSEFDNELRNYANLLISEVNGGTTNISDLFDKLDRVTTQANLRFRSMRFLLTTSDSIVYGDEPLMEPLADTLQRLISRRDGSQLNSITVRDVDYRVYAQKIAWQSDGKDLGMVVVASLGRLDLALARMRDMLLLIVPLSVLTASLGGLYTARRALKPVSEIRAAAATISSRNLHERVPVSNTRDELAELADTFNEMIARLERTFQSQRRFVADASHDLRTPLMVLQVKIDRLLQREDLPADARRDLAHCADEVEHLSSMAGDLLLLAKVDAHQLRPLFVRHRLDELMIDCVGSMKTLAEQKGVSLWVELDEAVDVLCDATMIQRALVNVLDNAIKHSPVGGTVSVRLVTTDLQASISIADSGEGIAEADIEKVFDRFYRSDLSREHRGTGLGLSIARSIIEAHHGTVDIASRIEHGTTITITLPVDAVVR